MSVVEVLQLMCDEDDGLLPAQQFLQHDLLEHVATNVGVQRRQRVILEPTAAEFTIRKV